MFHFHDVLIIGSGGSGLSLAIKLKQAGVSNVAILSKTGIMGSHTSAAKGGINAALGSISEDNYKWHEFDTLKSGSNLSDEKRVEFMCKTAPEEIEFLEKQGVSFDKLPNGKIDQRRYGGQKTNFGKGDFAYRSCFSSDKTGFEIMKNLKLSAEKNELKIYEYFFVFDAKREDKLAKKIYALNLKTGEIEEFRFKILVLAGGGFSQNYRTNSSSSSLTGDAHAIALKLGGSFEDMEFVQFHPTGLFGNGILISEAVRAEGGILLNEKNERFMEKYSPDFLELASRDVITKAIFLEGDGKKPAFLSLKHLPKSVIEKKLSSTILTAKFFGKIDVFKEDIPVFPTAHYNMGGIKVDFNYQLEEVRNVFAIGECAGGRIHGANRLGCNSLLELFTSSTLVKDKILEMIEGDFEFDFKDNSEKYEFKFEGSKEISFSEISNLRKKLGVIMEEKCGVLRNDKDLQTALEEVLEMENFLKKSRPNIKILNFNNEFISYFELQNLISLSVIVLESAIERRESRGSHIRTDFPKQDSSFDRF